MESNEGRDRTAKLSACDASVPPDGPHRSSSWSFSPTLTGALAPILGSTIPWWNPMIIGEFVVDKLQLQWPPEQIAHAIVEAYPDHESMRVSTERIYQAIYLQARGGLKREVVAALRTGRAQRKRHQQPEECCSRFVDEMGMIHDPLRGPYDADGWVKFMTAPSCRIEGTELVSMPD